MKTSKNSVKYFLLSLLGLGVVLLISCDTNNVNQKVLKAYELRLDGNADSAEALLDKVLKSDSTNAMAWYELARTKHHIGLGNPRELAKGLENIQLTIGKAVEHDNSNVIYAFYKGVISYTIAYVSVMRNLPDSKKMIDNVITDFKTVLNMKPEIP